MNDCSCEVGYECFVCARRRTAHRCTHTPADPGADECAADAAGEWLADLRMDGDL